jgi:serine/threonine-protein kinase
VFNDVDPRSHFDLWTVPLESDGAGLRAGTPEVLLQTPANERSPVVSPDGRWLAYSSDESGTYQIYVRPFPDKRGKWQVSNSGGTYPMWSRNGHELFFESTGQQIMVAAYAVTGGTFVPGSPRMWSEKKVGGANKNVDLAPDGKRLAALLPAAVPEGQHARNQVVFVLNFFDELQRRAAVGK